jgi:hypothetical protein
MDVMAEPGSGGGEEGQQNRRSALTATLTFLFLFFGSPAKALMSSAVLTVFSFLSHILFLFLVNPLKVGSLQRDGLCLFPRALVLCFQYHLFMILLKLKTARAPI